MADLFQKGDYAGKAVAGRFRSSREKKTPYVEVTFDLGDGHKKYVSLYLSDGAQQYSLDKLTRLGADTSNPEAVTFANPDQTLRCDHEEYKGGMKEKWDLAPVFQDDTPPPAADFIRQITAKLKSRVGQPGKSSAPPPKPPAPPPPRPPAPGKPQPTSSDAAYQALVAIHTTVKDGEWNRVCLEIATKTGKDYAAFTPADWQAVVDAYVPF